MHRMLTAGFLVLTMSSIAAAGQAPPSLSGTAEVVRRADALSGSADPAIWPGFDFKQVALFVFDAKSRQGALYHVTPLPSGFAADPAVPGAGIGSVPEGESLREGSGPVGGRLGAWIEVGRLSEPGDSGGIRALYRGAFKVFAAYRGVEQPGAVRPESFPLRDAEANALARAEDLIVIRMLTAPAAEIPGLMAGFLQTRQKRQSALAPGLAEWEWSTEVYEGLSDYAGMVAWSKLDGPGASASLKRDLERFGHLGEGQTGERFAATGCALAMILDRTGADWKTAFEKTDKHSLAPVLAKAAGVVPASDLSFVGIDGIRAEEAQAAAAENAKIQAKVDAVKNAKGLVLSLELESALQAPGVRWSNRYAPETPEQAGTDLQVREKYFNLVGEGLVDFASSRPILVETRKRIEAGFGPDEIPYMTLDGKPVELSAGQILTGRFELKGNHLTLTVSRARISYDPKVLTVIPSP